MMATTHALAGLLVGVGASALTGDAAPLVLAAGAFGGLFPDFDLYAGHRKTLHFPVYGSFAAVVGVSVYAVLGTTVALAVAVFLLAAALHAASDALGGGLELRPWEGTSERAVYDHFRRTWWRPRRLIRYDGAPEDALVGLVLAVPGYLATSGTLQSLVVVGVAVSVGYAVVRKPMVALAERLVAATPDPILNHVPDRFVGDVR
ncbi:metal-dependent hydrolase [Halarchaeum salinum]|uniref:Metal-dependent hydrolase n=1 Tax=Halarchaeum salinum TaxID=489912 RepID=A0AAV3S6Q8_9EURY